MLDKFEIGRNYRFSKEMWLEDMSGLFAEKLVNKMLKGWVSEIDGLKITSNSEFDGYVGNYVISPEWCEEIIEEDEKILLDKFEDGKRYRFNKELFTSYMELMGWNVNSDWKDDIHLYEVTILSDRDGKVGEFKVSPEWCEEVIVIKPSITRDDIKDMYKQVLYLEELEETLPAMDEYMSSGRMKSNLVKYFKSEIERVIDELGLEE